MAQNASEEQIRKIVEAVVQQIVTGSGGTGGAGGDNGGVFQTVDEAVEAATRAQKALVEMSLEVRKKIVEAIRSTARACSSWP